MKNVFNLLFLGVFALSMSCSGSEQGNANPNNDEKKSSGLAFTTYGRYFVKNTVQLDTLANFYEIRDTAALNAVFGAAAIGEATKWIEPVDFNENVVIAIAKDYGSSSYDLKITKISLEGSVLRVDYSCNLLEKHVSYTMVGDVLAMIKKQSYKTIAFYKNGILVKEMQLK